MTCNCQSYNKPEWGGTIRAVPLQTPAWSMLKGICIDYCLIPVIARLWWREHIQTYASCCGHHQAQPRITILKADEERVRQVIAEMDGREWLIEFLGEEAGDASD